MTGKVKQTWMDQNESDPDELEAACEEARRDPGHYSNPFEAGSPEALTYLDEKQKQWRKKHGI